MTVVKNAVFRFVCAEISHSADPREDQRAMEI